MALWPSGPWLRSDCACISVALEWQICFVCGYGSVEYDSGMVLRNCISEASDLILVWGRGFASGWSPAKSINSKNNVKIIVLFVGAKAH